MEQIIIQMGPPREPRRQVEAATLAEVEREHILEVVRLTGGNLSHAAELLGIGRSSLYRRLREYAAGGQGQGR